MVTPRSRYGEERTLVRAVLRLPGQSREAFKENTRRLRRHYEQFNADVSGLCQWLIRLRPDSEKRIEGSQALWEFLLQPEKFVGEDDGLGPDRRRALAFEAVTGWGRIESLADPPFSPQVRDSILAVVSLPPTNAARVLFARLEGYDQSWRMVLLKAAAEWVVAKYLRGRENWRRHHEEWHKERIEWETRHPELTEAIRTKFSDIFKQLEVREKRPRICSWDRLQQNKDNCQYTGEGMARRHSALCMKYKEFQGKNLRGIQRKYFRENAEKHLKGNEVHVSVRSWFPRVWSEYLRSLGLREETVREECGGRLPHCVNLSGECEFNPHTVKCSEYKKLLAQLPAEFIGFEPLYREWRRDYLSAPQKPAFRYPSAHSAPTAKIFGKRYFQANFNKSELGLRLDDMGEGEYLTFGFKPWPHDYVPQPGDTEITSVHVHFVGTRPRAGFRFRVPHEESRFRCAQDELDELRSRRFPRAAQDLQFLEAARELLVNSFHGDPEKELKLLTVDLGTGGGAHVALFEGKQFKEARPLKVVKIDRVYEARPHGAKAKGLGKEHVGRHLETLADESRKIAERRTTGGAVGLEPHDLRGLTRHVGWMLRDWARLNASQIIQVAEEKDVDLIVFESLRGFRAPGYDKLDAEKKRRLAFFTFGRIRRKVAQKAVEQGMRVVTVPYFFSSQVCSRCGRKQTKKSVWQRNKWKRKFQCEYKGCGYEGNSDENAARVLGRVFWGEIVLPTGDK